MALCPAGGSASAASRTTVASGADHPSCDPGWTVVPSPNPTIGNAVLFASAATAASDVWAAGYFDDGTALRTLTER